jgi:hypothetical protein
VAASSDGWTTCAALMEPFMDGSAGHHYLTTEGIDDALLELSFGEPNVRVDGDS